MALYLYAICGAGSTAPDGTGLSGSELRLLECGELAALVSEHPEEMPRPAEEDLWRHERVVERLMEQRDVLPARFGTLLDDDAAVESFLRENTDTLRERLRQVAGAVELGVRAVWAHGADGPDGTGAASSDDADALAESGAAYMRRRAGEQNRAQQLAGRVDAAVAHDTREGKVAVLPHPGVAISGSYLLDRERVEHFRECIAALDAAEGEAQIVCTGPWPPYSFVSGSDGQ